MTPGRVSQIVGPLLLCAWLGCQSGDVVVVNVTARPAEVTNLEVLATHGGRTETAAVPRNPDRFLVRLPESLAETVALTVLGRQSNGCLAARGQAAIEHPGAAEISVALAKVEERACTLSVTRRGYLAEQTRIVSLPSGIDCGGPAGGVRCEAAFDRGQRVQLQVTDSPSGFEGWSGACTGRDTCVVTIGAQDQELKVEALLDEPRVCAAGGWCWEAPRLPINLSSVWSVARNHVWAAGADGVILRWDGARWDPVPSGTRSSLWALWASSSRDAWAVGDGGTAVHWNGAVWTTVRTGVTATLRALWGRDANDVWAVGDKGTVLHWDGAAWTRVSSGIEVDLSGVAGGSGDEILIVGASVSLRWDGVTLSPVRPATDASLMGVWGSGPNDVWMVGSRRVNYTTTTAGVLLHWDGAEFSERALAPPSSLSAVWGSGRGEIWAAGTTMQRWKDGAWSTEPAPALGYRALWGSASNRVWAVGNGSPPVARWDGMDWRALDPALLPPGVGYLSAIWGSSEEDIWALTLTKLIRWNGMKWSEEPGPPSDYSLTALGGSGPRDVLVADWRRRLWRWDGKWSSAEIDGYVNAIWTNGPNDVWVVGEGGLSAHRSGLDAPWTRVRTGIEYISFARLQGVWGSGANDVWSIGENGTIIRWDGTSWRVMSSSFTPRFTGAWSTGGKDLWAVEDRGTIARWHGRAWATEHRPPDGGELFAIWGSDAQHLWAVGRGGYQQPLSILRSDGTSWTLSLERAPAQLRALSGTGPDDVWAVGDNGTILHWDGADWKTISAGSAMGFNGIGGSGPNDVWAVGNAGMILRWDGSTWSTSYSLPAPAPDLYAIARGPEDAWIATVESYDRGGVLRWDAARRRWTTEFAPRALGPVRSLWASGDEIWAGGSRVDRWSRANGSPLPLPGGVLFRDVLGLWGSGPNDVWAVGRFDNRFSGLCGVLAMRWDGAAWSEEGTRAPLPAAMAVWGSGKDDVWLAGPGGALTRWDGARLSPVRSGTDANLNALWGSGPSDIWAAGDRGVLVHWNGWSWSAVPSGMSEDLKALWGSGPEDVWVVGNKGTTGHWTGAGWTVAPTPTGTRNLTAVWGSGPKDVWAVGEQGTALRWDGAAWSPVDPQTRANLRGIWGVAQDLVIAVGDGGTAQRWDGRSWARWTAAVGTRIDFQRIWGASADHVRLAGYDPISQYSRHVLWDGKTWKEEGLGFQVQGLWSSGTESVWLVGQDRDTPRLAAVRWDGAKLTSLSPCAAVPDLYGLWGSGPNDIWAVGDKGAIEHWTGVAWSSVPSGTTARLNGVWGSGPNDVWAVGDKGALLRWKGHTWTAIPSGTTADLRAIWGSDATHVWIAGSAGILRYRP